MTKEKPIAILDNDFLQYFSRNAKYINGQDMLVRIWNHMDVRPVIHTYVYEQELFSDPEFQAFLQKEGVRIIQYEDFLENEIAHKDYAEQFKQLYQLVNGERLNCTNEAVFTYRKAQENLGEIHSLLTAITCGYQLFLSNDYGSKDIAKNHLSSKRKIQVYNILDIFSLLVKDATCPITCKEIKLLTKGDSGRKAKIKDLLDGMIGLQQISIP